MTIQRALFVAALFVGTSAFAGTDSSKPNIVFVLVDDLDQVITEPYYRDVLPQTMSLMDEEGMRFINTFVTTPLCCPARASILSGCYAHNTGVYSNGGRFGGWENFRDDEPRALPALLQKAGYRTFIDGKYLNTHHTDSPLPYGWTDGAVLSSPNLKKYKGYNYDMLTWDRGKAASATEWVGARKVDKYKSRPSDYSTDVVKNKALQFFERAKRENDQQPFFAYIAPTCPHMPLPPAPRHREKAAKFGAHSFPTNRPNYYRDDGVMAMLSGDAGIPADKPEWLQNTWKKRQRLKSWGARAYTVLGGDYPPDGNALDNLGFNEVDWYNRMGSLLACDEMVGEMVSWLKQNGEWDNTVFIFTSDNGYNLGAHSLLLKLVPYEESLRVPLYIAGGARTGISSKRIDPAWFLTTDFAPTLLTLAGVEVPHNMDGESHASRLKAEARDKGRDQFLIEYKSPGLAEGHLEDFEGLHYSLMPSMFLDIPPYEAIRAKRTVIDGGVPSDRDYLFVRWQPVMKQTKPQYELYDITHDPYQLDNLLHYQPHLYATLARQLEGDLDTLHQCTGSEKNRSCITAAHSDGAPVFIGF